MKLLCVIPSYWPAFQFGGPIFSLHELNKRVAEKGIAVTVYTTNAGQKASLSADSQVDVDNIRVHYFAYSKLFQFLGSTGWHFSLAMARAIRQNLKRFDLLYILGAWNYPVATAAYFCRQARKPYIISPRGQLYPYLIKKKFWKKEIYYNFVTKKDLNCASAIHYTTEDERQACHAYLKLRSRSVVIPNGIDLAGFSNFAAKGKLRERFPILKGKKIILFLSRINWKKGLDILVKAYSVLAKEKNDLHLLIVGEGDSGYTRKVKKWIKNCRLQQRVTFTGMLIGEDKLEAYAVSDIFVLPSYSENFGMSVVEAMACGLPVIITNQVGIHREVSSAEAGIVVQPDAAQLAKAMENLLDNTNSARIMGDNARLLVKEKCTQILSGRLKWQ
jgi:glycosyltransferase involved in cell wall biosynthesis